MPAITELELTALIASRIRPIDIGERVSFVGSFLGSSERETVVSTLLGRQRRGTDGTPEDWASFDPKDVGDLYGVDAPKWGLLVEDEDDPSKLRPTWKFILFCWENQIPKP